MTTLLTLTVAKAHLKVDTSDEDTLITLYLGAAEASAAMFLNRTIYADSGAMGSDLDGIVINDTLSAAILLTLGHLYEHRSSVDTVQKQEVPLGVAHLLQPYRINIGM